MARLPTEAGSEEHVHQLGRQSRTNHAPPEY